MPSEDGEVGEYEDGFERRSEPDEGHQARKGVGDENALQTRFIPSEGTTRL